MSFEEVFPALTAELIGVVGGIILAYAMFKYLPGMKRNAYVPREWVPVSITIAAIAWLTFVLPQFLFLALEGGTETLWQHFVIETLLFFTYSITTIITLILLQLNREGKD